MVPARRAQSDGGRIPGFVVPTALVAYRNLPASSAKPVAPATKPVVPAAKPATPKPAAAGLLEATAFLCATLPVLRFLLQPLHLR
jgi:hypothetical protein